jgi:M-phase inducer tyrosine phosphatase
MPGPGWHKDMFRSHPHAHYTTSAATSASISLREQLHKGTVDYFNAKDVRGSSPAASLAADISMNFRLDSDGSPRFPTPRRALFTASMVGGLEGRGMSNLYNCIHRPQLTYQRLCDYTSSTIIVSRAPHRAHGDVSLASQGALQHPDRDPVADSSLDPCRRGHDARLPSANHPPKLLGASQAGRVSQSSASFVYRSHLLTLSNRRKFAPPRRPSFTRLKAFSSGGPSSQSSPYLFGSDTALPTFGSGLSLHECFETASPPPSERRPHSANSPLAPAPLGFRGRQFGGISAAGNHRHGSPINFQGRRQSNPFLRNRKQYRRSLSMFEHPADVMNRKPDGEESPVSPLQEVADVEEAYQPVLPHFLPDDPADTIPRITQETLLDVLDGRYGEKFDHKMIIDCRFEYEYEGGHIDSAVNHNNKELLTSQLFTNPMSRTLLIFHCEYSAHRAPLMARHVRSEDRTQNADQYPKLNYPDVYILEGGYSAFFGQHRVRCYPPEYVEMSDANHQRTCEREMGRLKSRKGLSRAQTFAFGQREPCVDESPTGPSRPSSRQTSMSLLGQSPLLGDRLPSRRMASY